MRRTPRDTKMQRVGLIAWTAIVATSFLTLAPWILGGLVDQYGLTAAQGGQVLAVNLAGIIVGPLFALATVRAASVRMWVRVAFCAMAAGHGVTLFEHSFVVLVRLQSPPRSFWAFVTTQLCSIPSPASLPTF